MKANVKPLLFLLKLTHLCILLFLVFGPLVGWLYSLAFLSDAVLIGHLIAVPVVILHWQMNDGSCILTKWEKRLNPPNLSTPQKSQGDFTRRLLKKLFGIQVQDSQLFWVVYGCLALGWAFSLLLYLV